MKIVLITQLTPTEDNVNGPSALMYHLLINRDEDISLDVFTRNSNRVAEADISNIAVKLNATIEVFSNMKAPKVLVNQKVVHVLSRLTGKAEIPVSYTEKLPPSVLGKIRSLNPDLIWLYPHNCLGYIRQLEGYKMIITGPDCASLHLSRAFIASKLNMID